MTKFIEDERLWRTEEIEGYLGDDSGAVSPKDFERAPPVQKKVARFLRITVPLGIVFFLAGLGLSVALMMAKVL